MQSLAHQFLTFCRSKPADEKYNYGLNCGCAYFQFLESAGYPVKRVGGWDWTDVDGKDHPIPEPLLRTNEQGESPLVFGDTFGGLADRLEAHLAKAA